MQLRTPKYTLGIIPLLFSVFVLCLVILHAVLYTVHPDYRINSICTFLDQQLCQKIPVCKPVWIDTNPCKGKFCLTAAYRKVYTACVHKTSVTNTDSRQNQQTQNSITNVIIRLNVPFEPEGNLTEDEIYAQRVGIKNAQNTLISELMDLPCTFIVNHTYTTVPS